MEAANAHLVVSGSASGEPKARQVLIVAAIYQDLVMPQAPPVA